MVSRTPLLVCLLGATLLAGAANAQEHKLQIAVRAPATSLDPHFQLLNPNRDVAAHMFNALTAMDENLQLIPSLATSWTALDDTTWEFKLREGVKFHNGNDFTADDVAYTLERVPDLDGTPGPYAVYVRRVAEVEVVDDHTVRFKTDGVYPLLPTDLSMVFMLDRETHEGASTESFNTGESAVGTGPYRFAEFRRGEELRLVKNDAYWGEAPEWDEVSISVISNDASRMAALLSGDVDIIDAVPATDLERIARESGLTSWDALSTRVIYLWLDRNNHDGSPYITGPNGEALTRNPLDSLQVRQALSTAVDRTAITGQLMKGAGVPTGQFLPEGSFGYNPQILPPEYDPEGAKQLLADAGYPDGFHVTLHGPNDRYIQDSRVIQAIGQMWQRIGVITSVEPEPWSAYNGRLNRRDFSVGLIGLGSSTGEASNGLRSSFATEDTEAGLGAYNFGGYSNPEMDAVLMQAIVETDDAQRDALLQEATRLLMEDVGVLPLHIQKSFWASKDGLTFTPRRDESTRAMEIHPAP